MDCLSNFYHRVFKNPEYSNCFLENPWHTSKANQSNEPHSCGGFLNGDEDLMKKILVTLMVSFLCLVMLSGCSGDKDKDNSSKNSSASSSLSSTVSDLESKGSDVASDIKDTTSKVVSDGKEAVSSMMDHSSTNESSKG